MSTSSSTDVPVDSSSLPLPLSSVALSSMDVLGCNSLGSASRLLPLRRAAFAPCGCGQFDIFKMSISRLVCQGRAPRCAVGRELKPGKGQGWTAFIG